MPGVDLKAVVEAIRFVRRMTAPLREKGWIAEEAGARHRGRQRRGTRPTMCGRPRGGTMPRARARSVHVDAGGVLDGAFAVHGVKRLRVVDASVFPQHPGLLPRRGDLHDRGEGGRCPARGGASNTSFGKLTKPIEGLTLSERRGFRGGEGRWPMTSNSCSTCRSSNSTNCSAPARPETIPNGQADGTAIIAPGTHYTPVDRADHQLLRLARKVFDAANGVLKNKVTRARRGGHRRQGLPGRAAGSTTSRASCSTTRIPPSWPSGSATRSGSSPRTSTSARSIGARIG